MFFTQEDYRKIERWLLANSRKDTDFVGAATPLKGNETVVLVQDGKNVKTSVKDIVDQFFLLGVSDFLNITDKYGESYISLTQAIQLIPFRSRKIGQVITFIDESGNWAIYQFQGKALNQWNNTTLWIDLLAKVSGIPIIDSEDITTKENGANQVSLYLADKQYNEADYSGLGRIYLRKNIQSIIDPSTGAVINVNLLTQSMLDKENTTYIIQYDYNLNNQTITIPEGCILDMKGGSVTNGTINCVDTIIISTDASKLDVTLTGTYRFDSEKLVTSNTEDINIIQSVDRKSHTISAMLADRDTTNGMGYVILRKDKSFKEQVTQENTIYEIRYDFDLNEESITLPSNAVLYFNGGSANNGFFDMSNSIYGDISFIGEIRGSFGTEKGGYADIENKYVLKHSNLPNNESIVLIVAALDNITHEDAIIPFKPYSNRVVLPYLDKNSKKIYFKNALDSKYYINTTGDERAAYCNDDNSMFENIFYLDTQSSVFYVYKDGILSPQSYSFLKGLGENSQQSLIGELYYLIRQNKNISLKGDFIPSSTVRYKGNELDLSNVSLSKNPLSSTIVSDNLYSIRYGEKTNINALSAFSATRPFIRNSKSFIYNVSDFGIFGDGVTDVTDLLNNLFAAIKHTRPVIYFPSGVYIISKTIYPFYNYGTTIMGDGRNSTVIKFTPSAGLNNVFAIYGNPNQGESVIKDISVTADLFSISRYTNINDYPSPENGYKHFHTFNSSSLNQGISGIYLTGQIENCQISGFNGVGILLHGSFKTVNNIRLSNCNIALSSFEKINNAYSYNFDQIFRNISISKCKIGVLTALWNNVHNAWIDEIYDYAITNVCPSDYPTNITLPTDAVDSLALNIGNLHINHIDKCAIYVNGSLYDSHINGVINRTNCMYAGFTYEQLPNELQSKRDASVISANNIDNCYINFEMSNRPIGDVSVGDEANPYKAGVYCIYSDLITKSNVIITGTNNSDRGAHIEDKNNSKSIILYTLNNGCNASWDIANDKAILVDIGLNKSGVFNEKPTGSDSVPIGFVYYCTDRQSQEGVTDGIAIFYKGNNVWVDALGRVVS